MSLARTLILKVSDNTWLREHGTRVPFIRRAVSRFMPGEDFDDMLGAARTLAASGIDAVFTRLGENVRDRGEADDVAAFEAQVANFGGQRLALAVSGEIEPAGRARLGCSAHLRRRRRAAPDNRVPRLLGRGARRQRRSSGACWR